MCLLLTVVPAGGGEVVQDDWEPAGQGHGHSRGEDQEGHQDFPGIH